MAIRSSIQQGMVALGLAEQATPEAVQQLCDYLEMMQRWNRAYNLTSVRDTDAMVHRHILDSLSVGPFLGNARRCIDVGTGAGLPGMPLAIAYPECEFHLLDSNGKKTRFLFQATTELGLRNVSVHQNRVETFVGAAPHDIVLTRAFASLVDMVESCTHLCAPDGRLLAMKGVYPAAELEALQGRCRVVAVHPLDVPGSPEDEQRPARGNRHLVELCPVAGVDGDVLG